MTSERLAELHFNASPKRLHEMREVVAMALEKAGCEDQEARMLVLAVNEACMNVIQHGYEGDPKGEIILEILNNDGQLEFRLTDFAETLDPTKCRPRPLDDVRPGGLGTYFIQQIMDEFLFTVPKEGKGNLLIMRKKFNRVNEAPQNAV